ncbi:MAG TPA: AMP-binding protein, partial [Acidimicrobiia bacterium]|nr:AMP-binding protein [Acidimicrobiia bacterium]
MAEHLRELAEADPDGPAIIDEFATITRTELDQRVNRLVNGLRSAGVGAGDAVAVLCGNRHEWVEAVMASGIGAYVLVPLNWHLTADELAYILNDSGTRALLAEAEFAGIAAEALKGTSGVAVRLAIGGEGPEGFESYDDLLAAASPDEPTEQAAGTYMFYTSGTTGRPKGVRSSSFVVGMPVSVHAAMLSGLAGMFQI